MALQFHGNRHFFTTSAAMNTGKPYQLNFLLHKVSKAIPVTGI
jgi:hypothetical protein